MNDVICTCQPGSYDSGWQEVRCEDCRQEDRRVWTDFLRQMDDDMPRVLAWLRANRREA